jgi:hypothetical protein
MLSIIGWMQFKENSPFWQKRKNLLRVGRIWFWTINTILMLTLVFTFSKKTLVEPMVYLSHKEDLNSFIIEYDKQGMPWFPRYYLGRQVLIFRLDKSKTEENFLAELQQYDQPKPRYVFFFGEDNLDERRERMENLITARLELEKKINPSLIDYIVHKLNPSHNLNLTSYIYRCNYHEKDE